METRATISIAELGIDHILDSLADGVYITDTDRQIIFWNKACERITGWQAEEMVGSSCFDDKLVHIDKDGHQLCGKEYCPLHRAIVTGQRSTSPLLVFAKNKSGTRIPVEVSVAPVYNKLGNVIGGVEVFRDLTEVMEDLRRAQTIQQHALESRLLEDPRVSFNVLYTPQELVGGDFYRIEALDRDTYAILIADITGHGVSAALHAMQLRSFWEDFRGSLKSPDIFFQELNRLFCSLARPDEHFATAALVLLDACSGKMQYIVAGHPPPIILRKNGTSGSLKEHGPALGLIDDIAYEAAGATLDPCDTLVLYTDGATEVFSRDQSELEEDGLVDILKQNNNLTEGLKLNRVEEALVKFSGDLHLPDDLTLLAVKRSE